MDDANPDAEALAGLDGVPRAGKDDGAAGLRQRRRALGAVAADQNAVALARPAACAQRAGRQVDQHAVRTAADLVVNPEGERRGIVRGQQFDALGLQRPQIAAGRTLRQLRAGDLAVARALRKQHVAGQPALLARELPAQPLRCQAPLRAPRRVQSAPRPGQPAGRLAAATLPGRVRVIRLALRHQHDLPVNVRFDGQRTIAQRAPRGRQTHFKMANHHLSP